MTTFHCDHLNHQQGAGEDSARYPVGVYASAITGDVLLWSFTCRADAERAIDRACDLFPTTCFYFAEAI